MSSIASNNHLFTGGEANRVPAHNVLEVGKRPYVFVGVASAMSIVHGGPAPAFFSTAVADFLLYGLDKTYPTVNDIPDMDVREKIDKVCQLAIRTSNVTVYCTVSLELIALFPLIASEGVYP